MKKKRLVIILISLITILGIYCINEYIFYQKKKNNIKEALQVLNESIETNNLFEQSYYISSAIETYWYLYHHYPSFEELKNFVENNSIELFEQKLNLGIKYSENEFILYEFGYDSRDGNGKNIYQFSDINFFSSLFASKDIFLLSSELRDTSEIVESLYLKYRHQPKIINSENNDVTLDLQKNIDEFLLQIKKLMFQKHLEKDLLYARKKGKRYRLSKYKIDIGKGKIEQVINTSNNLIYKENLELIEKVINTELLNYFDFGQKDFQLTLPIYILEEDQVI